MTRDRIIGGLAVAFLLFEVFGTWGYLKVQGASGVGRDLYEVEWVEVPIEGDALVATTQLRDATEEIVRILQTNLTRIEFNLTWNPPQGTSTLRLTVTPPEGAQFEALADNPVTSEAGAANVTFLIPNEVPSAASVRGTGRADAHARLAEDNTHTLGIGEWTVLVEYVGSSTIQNVPGAPIGAAGGEIEWTLVPVMTAFEPELTLV